MFLARGRREVILIAMLFIAFMCVTAVFWAHTAHRSYLDVYLIVFAASVVERLWSSQVLTRMLTEFHSPGCLLKTKVDRDRNMDTEQQTELARNF